MVTPKPRPDSNRLPDHSTPSTSVKTEAIATCEADRGENALLPLSLESSQAMISELRSRQMELELQNQALRMSQEELCAKEEHYLQLFDGAPAGYCSVNAGGVILQANQTLASLMGRTVESLLNVALDQFVLPMDQRICKELQQLPLEASCTRTAELQMVKHDGSLFWVQVLVRIAPVAIDAPVIYVLLHDISERKRAEQTPDVIPSGPMSDALSRSVIDSVPARIAVLDREGLIVAVNRQWMQSAAVHDPHVGVTAAHTGVGANYLAICRKALVPDPDHHAQMAIDGIEAVLAGRLVEFSMEYPCHTKIAISWFSMVVTPLGPDIRGVVISHTDITQRKHADLALTDSEARFALFMNTLPAMAFIKNERGEMLYANRNFEQTFQLGNWAGKTSIELFPAKLAQNMDTTDRKALAAGYLVSEETILRPDGLLAVYQDHKFAIPRSGLPALLGCIALDVSEHRRIELAYRESQEHLNEAQSIANMGSWRADCLSGDVRWSDAQFKLLGYTPGSVSPSCEALLQRVLPQDRDRVRATLEASLQFGRTHHMEYSIQLPDGSQRTVVSDGKAESDFTGRPRCITGTIVDITDRKRIADELLAAKNAAVNASTAKSKFLAAASHDLRQPLAAMSLYVGALEIKADPPIKHLVNKIADCCAGLSELLNGILEVSKLEAGVVVPRIVDFSIDNFMHQMLSLYAPEAAKKGLNIRWRTCNTYAKSDPILMRRIMGNLLSNAIRYTARGGILIAYRRRDQRNWVEVWDTGIGIEEDKTEVIFQEFSQLDSKSVNPGSGLGLAIMAMTADLLGLKVRIRSRLGHGSMFAVELPQGHNVQEAVREETLKNSRPLRIALVENNSLVLDAVVYALEAAGHEVISAQNGKLLLARLGAHAPEIIIADYRLSEKQTGYEVIEAIRERFGLSLPALVMTGDTDPVLIRKMSQRGIAIQYKPLQLEALIACAMQQVVGGSL